MQDETHTSPLTGLTAAITGGAGELCGAMASALANRGVAVAILDIAEERARAAAEAIRKDGRQAVGVAADVTDTAELKAAAERIRNEFGGLDILINGAGGNRPAATTSETRRFFDLDPEAIRQVFELNCLGTIIPCQVFGELILETAERTGRRGNIVNISSMNAFRPLTRIPAYSAAKAAVGNFTQWLAVHMAQNHGNLVRVNAIAPGFFLTEQNRFLLIDESGDGYTPRGRTILDHSPAGRLGKTKDLLSTLFWLLDPASSFVNGVVVPVDGGFSAFSGV